MGKRNKDDTFPSKKKRRKNVISRDGKGTVFSSKVKITRNCLNKDNTRENFKKDPMNLIGTNQHINMTSDHSVSSSNWFKSFVNANSFNMFLTLL